jgi:hypothetical protein
VEHLTANIIMNLILFFDDYIRHRDGNFKVIKMAIHEMWTSFLRKKLTEILKKLCLKRFTEHFSSFR